MTDWTNELETLQAAETDLKARMHLARTMQPRQELLELEKQMTEDRQTVKDLRALAYSTATKNKAEIDRLKLETARLINESISIDNEAVMLELTLRPKQQEIIELRKQIEADKSL